MRNLHRPFAAACVPALAVALLAGCASREPVSAPEPPKPPAQPVLQGEIASTLDALVAYTPDEARDPFHALDSYVRGTLDDPAQREAAARSIEAAYPAAASAEAKRQMLRQLARIGSGESITFASTLIADPITFNEARFVLESNRDERAGMALIDALDSTSGDARIGVINSLGARREAGAVDALRAVALEPGSSMQAQAALAALGRVGTTDAARVLQDISVPGLEDERAFALANCGDRLSEVGSADEATVAFEAALAIADAPTPSVLAALSGLLSTSPQRGVEVLVACLDGTGPAPAAAAAGVARRTNAQGVDEALARALDGASQEAQPAIATVLAERGSPDAAPALRRLLESGDGAGRVAAAQGLAKVGGPGDVQALLQSATERGAIQQAARDSLATVSAKGFDEGLLDGLQASSADVRGEAARALGARRVTAAQAPLLARASAETDRRSRIAALRALGEVGGAEVYDGLVDLLLRPHAESDRPEIARALGFVGQNIEEDSSRIAPISVALAADPTDGQTAALIDALSKIGGEGALVEVYPFLLAEDTQVREAAVRALAAWPDAAALDELEVLSVTAETQTLRILSLQGLIRLLSGDGAPHRAEAIDRLEVALRNADRIDEERAALSALANHPHPKSFRLAANYFQKDELKAEAFAAAATIIEDMRSQYREHAREAARALAAAASTDVQRERAAQVTAAVRELDGFVADWLVSGPWTPDMVGGDTVTGTEYPPGQDPMTATWRHRRSDFRTATHGMELDLMAEFGGTNRSAYLMTHVWSPDSREAKIELGSDDGAVVWVGETEVYSKEASRAFAPATDVVDATLAEGWNRVMMRVDQGGGNWGGGLRIVDTDGKPFDDLRFSPAADGEHIPNIAPDFIGRYEAGDLLVDIYESGDQGGAWAAAVWRGSERGELAVTDEGDRLLLSGDAHGRTWTGEIAGDGAISLTSGGSTIDGQRTGNSSRTMGVAAPAGALVLLPQVDEPLLDAFDTTTWVSGPDGVMRVVSGDTRTVDPHGDAWLHLEFRAPRYPTAEGQNRGNSGVYLQDRYEIQVLDSFGLENAGSHCGGIYKVATPAEPATFPPGMWQTYDIAFRAPRIDANSDLAAPPRVTVFHNGILIHDDVELPPGGTGAAAGSEPAAAAPLRLQDHGHPVQYRNVWLKVPPDTDWAPPADLGDFLQQSGAVGGTRTALNASNE